MGSTPENMAACKAKYEANKAARMARKAPKVGGAGVAQRGAAHGRGRPAGQVRRQAAEYAGEHGGVQGQVRGQQGGEDGAQGAQGREARRGWRDQEAQELQVRQGQEDSVRWRVEVAPTMAARFGRWCVVSASRSTTLRDAGATPAIGLSAKAAAKAAPRK